MPGRAFVFTGAQQPFEQRDFPLPEVEPDGILVRVSIANIMGHEMTPWVARLGGRVSTGCRHAAS
jgi:hypothetical protein